MSLSSMDREILSEAKESLISSRTGDTAVSNLRDFVDAHGKAAPDAVHEALELAEDGQREAAAEKIREVLY